MIGDAVAPGVAHANHVEGDAHGHVVGISWDFDVTTGVKSGFELSRLDTFSFVLCSVDFEQWYQGWTERTERWAQRTVERCSVS